MERDLSANRATRNAKTPEPTAASHAALTGLVRLLARQAARELADQGREVDRHEPASTLAKEQT